MPTTGRRAANLRAKRKARAVRKPRRKTTPAVTPAPPQEEAGRPPYLVVAVGASAGGLSAFSALLRAIPGQTPIALVLVQHLARDQPSILPELLGNVTNLAVQTATDRGRIEAGHVYVIPPDSRMTIADGHLRVRPKGPGNQHLGTVDILFHSIAEEYRDRAVGVVLSGSATDGASGVREISAAGGITIAQRPNDAGVDGMPRAAIATSAIDVVLTAEEIGHYLARLAVHPFFLGHEGGQVASPSESVRLQKAFRILKRDTGVDFATYKVATLKRRIERRMAFHRLVDLGDYVKKLEHDQSEVVRLQEDLLIHVTAFFREPASYDALKAVVFPRLFERREPDLPLRFWVPGCSTGEEAYSLAMVALEYLDDRSDTWRLQIFGSDVSDSTIARARIGIYPPDIAANVGPERLRRFFTAVDGGYRINRDLRDRCVFARQDVTVDPPFSKLDLIVCRNLLIYLNQETQRKVMGVFHYALRPDGILMLGRSESIGSQADLFGSLGKKLQLYVKKADAVARGLELTVMRPQPPRLEKITTARRGQPAAWDAQSDANRFLLDRYAPPAVIVDTERRVLRSRGSTSAFLELPAGEVSLDVLKMARSELAYPLRVLLHQAGTSSAPVTRNKVRFTIEGRQRVVNLHVVPVGAGAARQFLIVFEEPAAAGGRATARKAIAAPRAAERSSSALERELDETRRQLQAIIDDVGASNEELQSANEEILSSNEELQSTNEELDTAKEELQSTNEELGTLNDELHARNEELSLLNSDLVNLLVTVQIPILIVTRNLRIRRVTPAAETLFNVIPSDIGRPIGHLRPSFSCPDLEQLIGEVIDSVTVRDQRVHSADGRTFQMQIRPYKSVDNRVDGAVIVLFDISAAEDQAAALEVALEVARATGETVLSTVREPILLLDGELQIVRANQAFVERFQLQQKPEGRYIYDLDEGQWNIDGLRRLLEEVLPGRRNFEGYVVEHDFPRVGRQRLLVDARRIESGRGKEGMIILVVREGTSLAEGSR